MIVEKGDNGPADKRVEFLTDEGGSPAHRLPPQASSLSYIATTILESGNALHAVHIQREIRLVSTHEVPHQ